MAADGCWRGCALSGFREPLDTLGCQHLWCEAALSELLAVLRVATASVASWVHDIV